MKNLNLTEVDLESFRNLERFDQLHTLVLDKNYLPGLSDCPSIPSLHTLWFNNNAVEDLPRFMDEVTTAFPNLRVLSMMRYDLATRGLGHTASTL